MSKDIYDLIIIGAGAAGLSAAIAYKRKSSGTLMIIDGNPEAGQKILATGNGRCNLSNTGAPGWEGTRAFFDSLEIMLDVEEEGRVYPQNRQAASVRNILYGSAVLSGADFAFNRKVISIEPNDDYFSLKTVVSVAKKTRQSKAGTETQGGAPFEFKANQVIVATGGKAGPQFGSTGDGFAFARKFDIKVNSIRPALVPLVYDDSILEKLSVLKGVRAKARVRLLSGGNTVLYPESNTCSGLPAESKGEIQFTGSGLSGICIFDISLAIKSGKPYEVEIDFLSANTQGVRKVDESSRLSGIVNERLAEMLSSEQLRSWKIPIKGTLGWRDAQATAGGVSMTEIDNKTFAARQIDGLYFAGEVLDHCGHCGGYNLDFAWNSGIAAGESAAGAK